MAKKEKKPMVKCIECRNAKLLQWDNNPIISVCNYRMYKDVANTPRQCIYFVKIKGIPKVLKQTR